MYFTMNLDEEDLDILRRKEENDDLSPLIEKDTKKILSLKDCMTFLNFTGDFSLEVRNLRYNSPWVTREKWDKFARNSENYQLLE